VELHYNKNVGRMNSDHLHVPDVNIFLSHKERGITMNEYRKDFWMTDKLQCLTIIVVDICEHF
jgi:hypothetical protein